MEDLIALDERPQRTHRMRWFDVPDLVGVNLYDTPTGEPLSADESLDLDELNEVWGERFTGEVLSTDWALARTLPGDTYVPVDQVVAVLTAAVWWGKPVHVSWMQMDFDPLAGAEVPLQHHRQQAAVMYIDDDLMAFAVATPKDLIEPVRILTPCVTDIRLVLFPTPPEQLPGGVQVDG